MSRNRHLTDDDLDSIIVLLEERELALLTKILAKIQPAPTPKKDVAGIRLLVQGAKVQLTDAQQVTYTIQETDPAGAALATPEGSAVWSADDGGAFVTLTPSADGFSCLVAAASGANGTATVTATVTVTEPSDGSTQTFTGSDGVVVAVPLPDVAGITLTAGTPEAKP